MYLWEGLGGFWGGGLGLHYNASLRSRGFWGILGGGPGMHYNASLRSGGFFEKVGLRDAFKCKLEGSQGTLGDAI